ncbi:MAG: hypothetical protein HKM22_03985 [Gammaproteobacteria bacterium]|nr:hypothetical protein [Gammaproteobacteria bacterium]
MNTLHFYVNSDIDADRLTFVKADLMAMSHVRNVEIGKGSPRELMIDVDEHSNMTMSLLDHLNDVGLKAEISYS